MSRNTRNRILYSLLYGSVIALFAMALSYFLWSWMGVADPPILRDALLYFLTAIALLLMARFWKVSSILFILLLLYTWATWPEISVESSSSFVWIWLKRAYDAFFWWLTLNPFKGAMPLSFPMILRLTTTLAAFISIYAIPFPPLSLLLLASPLFFIPELSVHPKWLAWLFVGLFAITVSFYRSAESEKRALPHPGIVAGLLATAFFLQSLLSPSTFFNPELSIWINNLNPSNREVREKAFTLESTGYYPKPKTLGGSVTLVDQPIMDVFGPPYSFYLRGASFTEFLGDRWDLPSMQAAVEYEPFPLLEAGVPEAHRDVLWPNLDDESMVALSQLYQMGSASVVPLTRPQFTVFSPGILYSIMTLETLEEQMQSRFDPVEMGNRIRFTENLILTEDPIGEGLLIVGGFIPTRATDGNRRYLSTYRPATLDAKRQYEEVVQKHDPLLHRLLYEKIANSLDDPTYLQVYLAELQDHFQAHYPYSLRVQDIPPGRTIVDWFLETKTGYCVYYGTLTTVLLRDIGVEARYAEGFLVPESQDLQFASNYEMYSMYGEAKRTVTSNSAHAWTEIRYEEIGWYPLDTTPEGHIESLQADTVGQVAAASPSPTDEIEPQRNPDTAPRTERPDSPQTRLDPAKPNPFLTFLDRQKEKIAAGFAILLYLAWRRWVFKTRHDMTWIEKKYANHPDELARRVWKDIQSMARIEPIDLGTGTVRDTLLALADTYSVKDIRTVSHAICIIEQTLYSPSTPSYENLQPLLQYHRSLEGRMRAYLPSAQWFFMRWLWTTSNPL